MNSKKIQKLSHRPAIYNIVGELKYRALYLLLVVLSLLGLVYLKLGLIIEFQGSYYLNYYQFIDFNWREGVKELNEGLISNSIASDKNDSSKVSNLIFFRLSKLLEGLGLLLLSLESFISSAFLWSPFDNETIAQVEKLQVSQESNSTFFNSTDTQNAWESKANALEAIHQTRSFAFIELDEYKPFFISTLSYFEKQIKFIYSVSCKTDVFFFEKPKNALIYLMFVFYQLTGILAYHGFCLVSPGITQPYRLKLIKNFLVFYLILCLHFIYNPMIMAVYFELQIESLDSELFYGNSFDFLKLWVKCFYWLHFFLVLVLLFYFFVLQ
uniref:SecY-independent transporter protein n=1 Tax=Gloeotilopsis planctonica TaxID=34157 RepID=A0A1B2RYY5_9CHLO|nr:SecY-independent transporter protein [Gloeotilopsis planctonica]